MSYSIAKAEAKPSVISVGQKPTPAPLEVVPPAPTSSQAPEQDTPEEKPQQDPRIAELERKEKILAAERRKLAQEKAAIEAQKAQLQQPQSKPGAMTADEWKAQFLQDPTKLGIQYDEIAHRFLTQPDERDQVVEQLKSEIQALRQEREAEKEQLTAAQKQAYDNAVKQIDADARRLVESKPQEYELISAEGAHSQIVELIKRTYEEEQVLMSVEEAAQEVENYLLERATRYAGLNKVKSKIAPPPSEEPTTGHKVDQTPTQQKTLTRGLTPSSKPMSARERAIAAFVSAANKTNQ